MTGQPGTGQTGWHDTQLRGKYDKAHGTWDGDFDAMETLLDGMNHQPLDDASQQFRKASSLIYASNDEIYNVSFQLADAWKGPTAGKAIAQLQALWNSSNNLMGTASMLDTAFGNHAQTIKDATSKGNRPTKGSAWESAAKWGAGGSILGPAGAVVGGIFGYNHQGDVDNQNAKDYINNQLSPRTTSDHDQVPADLRVDIASVNPKKSSAPNLKRNSEIHGGGGNLPGGGGGGAGHLPGGTGGHLPSGTGGHLPSGTGGHLPGGTGGHLPGGTGGHLPGGTGGHLPGSVGSGGADLAGLPGGGGGLGGGLGGHGGGLGGGLGGAGGGLGGAGGGLGGAGGGLGGVGALDGEAAAARAAMAGKNGMGGMPMGGMGGGGGQQEERERTTWLTEDEDVWGGDGDAAPPVIG